MGTTPTTDQTNDQYNGQCRSGALSPAGMPERGYICDCISQFDLIRDWADERGLLVVYLVRVIVSD